MSATIITMADFEASKPKQPKQPDLYAALGVLVHWSESGQWEEGADPALCRFRGASPGRGLGLCRSRLSEKLR